MESFFSKDDSSVLRSLPIKNAFKRILLKLFLKLQNSFLQEYLCLIVLSIPCLSIHCFAVCTDNIDKTESKTVSLTKIKFTIQVLLHYKINNYLL